MVKALTDPNFNIKHPLRLGGEGVSGHLEAQGRIHLEAEEKKTKRVPILGIEYKEISCISESNLIKSTLQE